MLGRYVNRINLPFSEKYVLTSDPRFARRNGGNLQANLPIAGCDSRIARSDAPRGNAVMGRSVFRAAPVLSLSKGSGKPERSDIECRNDN
jgi:hypothetical protein